MNEVRSHIDDQSHKAPERLTQEIEQNRDRINEIVSALEDRLSPGQMLDRMIRFGKGNGGEMTRYLGNAVKANPVPAVLVAAGLVWLYAGRHDQPHSLVGQNPQAGDEAGHSHLGERAAEWKQGASDTLHSASARASGGIHAAGAALQRGSHRARSAWDHLLHEHPMAAGAIAVATGALLGALLPNTTAEDELLGELSDDVTDRTKGAARDAVEAGKRVAGEAGAGTHPSHEQQPQARSSMQSNTQPQTGIGTSQ